MAAEASRQALDATGETRAAFLTLAGQWLALAEELERSLADPERG